MNFSLHQFKKRLLGHAVRLSSLAAVIAIVIATGLASSWHLVEAGFGLTTRTVGPWVMWTSAARTDADPYTRAHFARIGTMVLSTEVAHTYLARTDNDGLKLHSSCDYAIEGRGFDASWWSLAAFDEHGRLIANPMERHAFTSDTIAAGPDGRFAVTLARDARPGNWLPTGGAGRLAMMLTLFDPAAQQVAADTPRAPGLPTIRKVLCR
ncbi:MAG: DUF1214 domain-containing protein [Hyphomicrobium sp.]